MLRLVKGSLFPAHSCSRNNRNEWLLVATCLPHTSPPSCGWMLYRHSMRSVWASKLTWFLCTAFLQGLRNCNSRSDPAGNLRMPFPLSCQRASSVSSRRVTTQCKPGLLATRSSFHYPSLPPKDQVAKLRISWIIERKFLICSLRSSLNLRR